MEAGAGTPHAVLNNLRAGGADAVAGGRRLRVLMVTPRPCWPPNTGAKLRNLHLARGLARSADVTIATFGEDRADRTDADQWLWPGASESITLVRRSERYRPDKLLRGLLGRTPFTVLNYTTPQMANAIEVMLERHPVDVVLLEGIHLISYLRVARRSACRPAVVCDWHNIESEILARYADRCDNLVRRRYARMTAKRLARMERWAAAEVDGNVAVASRDADALVRMTPSARVAVVDNGVDVAHYSDHALDEAHAAWVSSMDPGAAGSSAVVAPCRNRVLFVGAMGYHANVEAVEWFARAVWPTIHQSHPGWIFTIVGRDPGAGVRALGELAGVEVTGTVSDVRPYYREAIASVAPLHVGGGSRLKILESMAAGVPVVSTRLGAEGLAVNPDEDILLAETAAEFESSLAALGDDRGPRTGLIANGRRVVAERYDWSALSGAMLAFLQQVVARRAGVVGEMAR